MALERLAGEPPVLQAVGPVGGADPVALGGLRVLAGGAGGEDGERREAHEVAAEHGPTTASGRRARNRQHGIAGELGVPQRLARPGPDAAMCDPRVGQD